MRYVIPFAALASFVFSTPAGASPRIIPQPRPRPLGELIRESKTLHVLQVSSLGLVGVNFKTLTALKGETAKAPFDFLSPLANGECNGVFRAGAPVLCFRLDSAAILHAGGRWILAVEPIQWRGEKHWFCMAENDFAVTYEGTTEGLREHVQTILAGRETAITARAPLARGELESRLWRIKAGPKVTEFVLFDDSPHFVGWGTGEAGEVPKLAQALSAVSAADRIGAANDLGHFGAAAKPALPALRRALKDSTPEVVLAAAAALVRISPDADDAVEAIQTRLSHADMNVRAAAATALSRLGARASAALPALLRALQDKEVPVCAVAAAAIGPVAARSPREAVIALTALLRQEKAGYVQCSAIESLRCLGPIAWTAVPALLKSLSFTRENSGWYRSESEALALLARFDPPAVASLAGILADPQLPIQIRHEAAQQLAELGSSARLALPTLRRVLQSPQEEADTDMGQFRLQLAEAILAIDPETGPAVAAPALHSLTKSRSEMVRAVRLLSQCGAAARPFVSDVLKSLESDSFDSNCAIRHMTPFLSPEDRQLLPLLRQQLSGKHGDPVDLASLLYRLGNKEEALAEARLCLTGDNTYLKLDAARWLGKLGKDVREIEPSLRRALTRASDAERGRLALTLWKVSGGEAAGAKGCAFAALDNLLLVCEGDSPIVSRSVQFAFWERPTSNYAAGQENESVIAAVGAVHARLESGGDAVAVLTRFVKDSNLHIRLPAVLALARADPSHAEIVPVLQKLLLRRPHFFCYSVDTLAALGPVASPLAPQIETLLRGRDPELCRAAVRVLRRISPAAAAKGWGAAGAAGAVPADLVPLWEDLAGEDALRADLAAWRLAGAGPPAVAILRERLHLPPVPAPELIARLIADLDSPKFGIRRNASAELTDTAEAAAPALKKALADGPTLELRRRIEALLAGLDFANGPDQRRWLHAVRLLEAMGDAEARALLKKLAGGDRRFALVREAAAALHRLDH